MTFEGLNFVKAFVKFRTVEFYRKLSGFADFENTVDPVNFGAVSGLCLS